jgi:hypothetical protein
MMRTAGHTVEARMTATYPDDHNGGDSTYHSG